jgi:hypothetical protein
VIRLKVNHLVHLQDARYCAALPSVALVSFALDRESHHHLPLRDVLEIIEWLSGPTPVLDFGNDAEQLNTFLAGYFPENVCIQVDASLAAQVLLLPEGLASRTLVQARASVFTRLEPHFSEFAGVEWLLSSVELHQASAIWAERLQNSTHWLNTDDLDPDQVRQLQPSPHQLSMRKWVEADLHHLDFDKFEITLAQLQV